MFSILYLLPILSTVFAAHDHRRYCTALDNCWPSKAEWNAFNASIEGRLIASRPSASVCHGSEYDQSLCDEAKANWVSSDWRTSQPGAYSAILWEVGEDQCFIDTPMSDSCQQGLVAQYSVNASNTEDVSKSVQWALKHELLLTIKNTGHDHLGRSSGKGSFAIWTHHLKGREWHTEFVPKGATGDILGVPAVTLAAGEQWLDVYRDADQQGRIVVGGSARTVGTSGGWFTGGGHSAWSHFYGLGVDNVLEVDVVMPTGEMKTLNQNTDPEHFWAIRGGGGNAFGIVTSITYRTHPLPTNIKVVAAQFNTSTSEARREVLGRVFQGLSQITDLGFTGYGSLGESIGLIFIQPNGTNTTADEAVEELVRIGNVTDAVSGAFAFDFPSWIEYTNVFLQDPNIATNVIDPSRLLTARVLETKWEQLVDLIMDDFHDLTPGFNFIGKVDARNRDNTAVHSIWAESRAIFSMGTDWADNASNGEKHHKKLRAVEASERLAVIVDSDSGTYINEANPYEPDWQQVFWGEKYSRLEYVKKRIDPEGLFVCNRCVGGAIVYEP